MSCVISLILFIFLLLEEVFPVTMTSISIRPVVGSVAACWVANFIKAIASSTSFYYTRFESLILAKASLILIND